MKKRMIFFTAPLFFTVLLGINFMIGKKIPINKVEDAQAAKISDVITTSEIVKKEPVLEEKNENNTKDESSDNTASKEAKKIDTSKNTEKKEVTKEKSSQKSYNKDTPKPVHNQTPSASPSNETPKLLIDRIKQKGTAEQAIVVTSNSFNTTEATVTAFEKTNGTWHQVYSFPATIGMKGFTSSKKEGDGASPIGIYTLGTAFGTQSNPGTALNYRQSSPNDYWVDDTNSSLYNTWQQGSADGRWSSAESMYIPQYTYGFVINYNTAKRIPGKGSAIFFHVWSAPGKPTEGCTAASKENVIKLLKWIKPAKKPIIIQGPASEVLKI